MKNLGNAHTKHSGDTSFYIKLLDTSQDVICALDAEGKFIFTNSAANELWGYTPAELLGRMYSDLVTEQDITHTTNALAAAKSAINKTDFENNCICRGGIVKPFSWSVQWDKTNQILFCVVKDITTLKQAEKVSKSQASRLDRAYKLVNFAWWEYDVATQTYTASHKLFHILGLPTPDDHKITLKELLTYVHPDDVQKLQADILAMDQDTYIGYEHRMVTRTGEIFDIIHYAEVLRNADGKAIRVEGAGQDISNQKKAEELVRQSEQKYKLLFNQSLIPKLIFRVDNLRITEVNDAALSLYGYSREEILNLTIVDLRPPEDRDSLYDAIKKYKDQRQGVFSSMHRHMKKDGMLFFVQIEASLIELASGMHSLVIANDMTEKLQMQHRLINEKVTAQKEIAKAIIQTQEQERKEIGKELHDNVNQILTTVKLYIENIRSFPEYQATFIEKTVTLTQKAIDEIRLLSKQLVSPVINDLNFKAAIIELVEHYRWLNLFEIEYTFEADENLLDKDMQLTLYRIIQEQMNNIVKHAKATYVTISIVTDKESLTVSLSDDGVGFEATAIVDGVGIRNIKNRAEVYKGVVNLHTSPGKGCSLMITFPCIQPS